MVQPHAPSTGAASRYQVMGRLAGGGMAEILLGKMTTETGIAKHVVLKRVLAEYGDDPNYVKMFLDEARLCFALAHPNIAQVYDFAEIDGAYYLAMEYVHGENTHQLLVRNAKSGTRVPLDVVATIIVGAAGGLHHAHTRTSSDRRPLGIVHRDVSPSNIMLSFEGGVKVVDFGVAKATKQQAMRSVSTNAGATKGKVGYMSPEQIRTPGQVDRRSDIFSLGIVMWELLTCKRLYRRKSDIEAMDATCNEIAAPPSKLRSDVPVAFDAVVARALAKHADDRFATAGELLVAVEKASVATGLVLSTFNLGQYISDLLGETPEPWLELSTVDRRSSTMARASQGRGTAAKGSAAPRVENVEATEVEGQPFPSEDPHSQLLPFDAADSNQPDDDDEGRWLPEDKEVSVATAELISAKLTGLNPTVPRSAAVAVAIGEIDEVEMVSVVDTAAPVPVAVKASPASSDSSSSKRRATIAIALIGTVAVIALIAWKVIGSTSSNNVVASAPVADAALPATDAASAITVDSMVAPIDAVVEISMDAPSSVDTHTVINDVDAAIDVTSMIAAAADKGKWNAVTKLCNQHPNQHQSACAVAACELGDRVNLRRYLRIAPDIRRALSNNAKCNKLLKPSGAVNVKSGNGSNAPAIDCEKDPLKCQF
jgi:eukaryotic-like serine/threonine-protein kinase